MFRQTFEVLVTTKRHLRNYKLQITLSITIVILFADTSLARISDLIRPQFDLSGISLVFTTFIIIALTSQYLILRFFGNSIISQKKARSLLLSRIRTIITMIQYILIIFVLITTLQILLASYLYTDLLFVDTLISYSISIAMLGLLSWRFLEWFRSNKTLIVLLYCTASIILMLNSTAIMTLVYFIWLGSPNVLEQHVANLTRIFVDPMQNYLNTLIITTSIISFILMWIATAKLLRHYSDRIGRKKYWLVVSVPLVYFISQFPALLFHLFGPLLIIDPAFYGVLLTLIYSSSRVIGGILFGISFWLLARTFNPESVIRKYLIIAACGLILLFVSNQANVLWVTLIYPPFGLPTISFVGLSAYLILIGIYNSAISVSQDIELRKLIRKDTIKLSKLLDSIGVAEMQEEVHRKIMKIAKENRELMEEDSGVTSSLTEEDIKRYLDEAIEAAKIGKE